MGRPLKKDFLHVIYIHPYDDSRGLITKQKGSRRYECQNNGADVFKLVATTDLDPHQAWMQAYDSDGNVYFVIKLTRHFATLIQKEKVGVPPYQFANGKRVEWEFGSANAGLTVQLENDD